MSGEYASLPAGHGWRGGAGRQNSGAERYRILFTPSADEAQGHADALREMLASGELDQRVVRAAANALEALALGSDGALTLTDGPAPAPIAPPADDAGLAGRPHQPEATQP